MTAFQVYQVRKMLRQGMTYGAVCDRTGSTLRQIHALQYGLVSFALLVALCALASLSGCLTATKIHRWESALVGWARKGKPECVESAKVASKYLVNANRTLAEAGKLTDLASDSRARELVTSAALACGRRMP